MISSQLNRLQKTILCLVFLVFSNLSISQNSKFISFHSEVGVYQPVLYDYSTLQYSSSGPIIGNEYSPEETNYDSFFDQYCLTAKYGIGFEQELEKTVSYSVGLSYQTSYNNFGYEHIYTEDNLYGVYQAKEKFNAITLDGLMNIQLLAINDQFTVDISIGFELYNLFRYKQSLRVMRIGEFIDGEREEALYFRNKNEFSRVNYLLLFRPKGGLSFRWNFNEKTYVAFSPFVTSKSLINRYYGFIKEDFPPKKFEPYRNGEYRNSITFSTMLSVGYKL